MALGISSTAGSRLNLAGSPSGFTAGAMGCWIKTSSATANTMVASAWNGSSRSGCAIVLNSAAGKARMEAYDATTNRVAFNGATTVNTGSWVHLLINFNTGSGSTQTLFVNGVSDGTGSASAAWSFSSASIVLGGFISFWASLNGDIAEFGFWSRNLSADEAAALGKGFAPNHIALENLEWYHPMVRDFTADKVTSGAASFTLSGTAGTDHPRILGGLI